MEHNQATIVVGVDGSEASNRAVRWATDMARAAHRPLTLVHAVTTVAPAYAGAAMVSTGDAREALVLSGRAVVEIARKNVEGHAPGVEVREVIEFADAGELLVEMSGTAAAVVVGSHGRGPVLSKLLGSVGVHLVRRAHCPVVVVRPAHLGTVRHGVLVGLDALPESQPVLEFAYREASQRRLPLTILHAAWSSMSGTMEGAYLPATRQEREAEKLALAEAMAGMAEKYPDVRVTSRFAEGRPEELLVRMGGRMDLIVVGCHQTHGLERMLFGSVSVSVVEYATCPVVVVPVAAVRA